MKTLLKKLYLLVFLLCIFSENGVASPVSKKEKKHKKYVTCFLDKVKVWDFPKDFFIQPCSSNTQIVFFSIQQKNIAGYVHLKAGYIEVWQQHGERRCYFRDDGFDGVCDQFNVLHAPLYEMHFHRPTPREKEGWQKPYRKIMKTVFEKSRTRKNKHGLFSGVRCFVYGILLHFLCHAIL